MSPPAGSEAQCLVHPGAAATFTCARCGSFSCDACRSGPSPGRCQACAARGSARLGQDVSAVGLLKDTFGLLGSCMPAVGGVALATWFVTLLLDQGVRVAFEGLLSQGSRFPPGFSLAMRGVGMLVRSATAAGFIRWLADELLQEERPTRDRAAPHPAACSGAPASARAGRPRGRGDLSHIPSPAAAGGDSMPGGEDLVMGHKHVRQRFPLFLSGLLLTLGASTPVHAQAPTPPMTPPAAVTVPAPQALASAWEEVRSKELPLPPLVRHPHVEKALKALRERAPDLFGLEVIGHSVEGRALYHLSLGSGARHVLLWSQMHGDEPTATTALLDFLEYVRTHREEPWVARMLSELTLHAVPLLNPDGAERFQRRNAQGIDINRDALALQTPEARALKGLRDRLQPFIGFNLHNQGWRHAVGRTGRPASISVLAAAFDEARSDNPGRVLAKKVCAVIRDTVETLAPGQVGRYDDSFEVRAFGDNMTRWGTPSVLIETGAWTSLEPDAPLVRLNFVALATALDALASGKAAEADVARYDSIPENNSSGLVYLLVKDVGLFNADGGHYTADLGIAVSREVRGKGGALQVFSVGRVEELGDLRTLGAIETVNGAGLFAVPLSGPAAKEGGTLRMAKPGKQPVRLGQAAQLMLLKPLEQPSTWRIERVIRFDR